MKKLLLFFTTFYLMFQVVHFVEAQTGDGVEYFVQAEELKAKGMYPQAIAAYDKALEKEPQNLKYMYNRCGCFQSGRKPQEALACFKEILKLKPNYIEVYEVIGEIYQNAKKPASAIENYALAATHMDDPGAKYASYFKIITYLFSQGKIVAAYPYIQKAQEIVPGDEQMIYFEARYYNVAGKHEKAKELMRKNIENFDGEVGEGYDRDYYEYGFALYQLGEYEAAFENFAKLTEGGSFESKAKELSPKFLLEVANIYNTVYEIPLAKELLQRISAMKPDLPGLSELSKTIESDYIKADTSQAKLAKRLNNTDRQLPMNEKVLTLNGLSKGSLLLGNYDEALDYARQLYAIKPSPLGMYFEAIADYKVGNDSDAESLLFSLSRSPKVPRDLRGRAAFTLGLLQRDTNQLKLAAQSLRTARKLDPRLSPAVIHELNKIDSIRQSQTLDDNEDEPDSDSDTDE
ncbi:MAG: hypothetical protein JJT94_00685 [Bernardetiaceae bacterium]|nr:hypothetical protein [Bernardetiaceae bacterium]